MKPSFFGTVSQSTGLRLLAAISLVHMATIASQAAGTVTAWGANDTSQCQVPAGLTNVVSVAGGASHSLALKADGTVAAWGFNLSGQTSVPPGLAGVKAVAAGSTYSMALKQDGSVVVWGALAPVPETATNVTAIAAGWSHALALRADRTVVGWGSSSPVPQGLNNVLAIAAGNSNSLALKADGSIVAWGDGSYGKTNVPNSRLTNVIAIAAGGDHCLALQQDGLIIGWGRNNAGQISVPSGLRAVSISGGARHSLALKTDGSLAAWGDNTYNQTVVNPAESGFIGVSAGGYHNLAIRGDGNPFILLQPISQTVLISKPVTFQVIATGTQPLSYQWRLYGTNLPGATSSSFTLTNVQMANGGPYQVVVQNVFGSTTSVTATLTPVGGAPVVVAGPTNQTVICGDAAAFQVSVGGSSPFNYQWQFNEVPIAGATRTSLQLTNVTAEQEGYYSVIAANAFGYAITGAVLRVVVESPAITSQLTAAGAQGVPFNYTITALHSPTEFRAQYLPGGLTLNTNTGVISGAPTASGTYGTRITAINACSSDTQTLVITVAPSLPVITSPVTATGTEGQAFTYQITATASPTNFGAINLPVGLTVNPTNGLISGMPTYAGTFDSTLWASNAWGAGYANVQFTFGNATVNNINIGNVTYNYSKPYLLDFQFSLYTITGDPTDPNAPTTGLVIDPKLLSATCLEDDVPNSPTETGSFIVQGNSKVMKVYLVLDFTESIASLSNGDQNGDGISDAVEFMVNGALDFVNQQAPDTQVGVIEFHRDDMAPSNVVMLTTDKLLLRDRIAGIYTNYVKGFSSGSRCWDAVQAAITGLGTSNRDEQHYVIFVSDGRDESSTTAFTNVVNAATAAAVKVFALGFGGELDATTLQALTSQTQGQYYDAGNDPTALAAKFAEITKSSKGQYILRWATLKRPSRSFTPSFQITYNGLTALSPTNPYWEDTNNPIIDTNSTPPTTNYNWITNFIIGIYNTADYSGPPAVGSLRVVPNTEVRPTGLDLRATYVPRNIRQLRIRYRPNWPCVAQIQSSGPGEILAGWSLTETNDGAGGTWMLLSSPNPTNASTSIPFASFGKLVTFHFSDVINPATAFSLFEVDNTIYANTGGQSFTIENTNSFIRVFPLLPYGTPVPWLNNYGFTANYTNAEVLDSDGDGMLNWQEYRANTIPTNALSLLLMRGVSRLPDGRVDVTFLAATNRVYRLEGSVDLSTWQTVRDLVPGRPGNITVRDDRYVPGAEAIYYRVLVY